MPDAAGQESILLNVGSGDHPLPGFINIDLLQGADVRADLARGLPVRTGSVDGIFSEHFIEHLSPADGMAFLRDCRRAVKPGGRIRIATPDLKMVIEDYRNGTLQPDWEQHGYGWITGSGEMLNLAFREWGHQWLYDPDELTRLAELAGLALLGRCQLGRSDDPRFTGLEYRAGSNLILEFTVPGRIAERHALASILIPSYNPRYFKVCLESALAQDYPNVEIIVSDDCPSAAIRDIVEGFADHRIRYSSNSPGLGDIANHERCLDLARGEYIKYLSDDDLLAPHCLTQMIRCLRRHPAVTLVTSHRQRIDAAGRPLPDDPATKRPVDVDSIISGQAAVHAMLKRGVNYIGEPTTALFRKQDIACMKPFMSFAGVPVRMNGDVTMWMNLLSQGDLIYLTESLSSFRRHNEQRQQQADVPALGAQAWERARIQGVRYGLYRPDDEADLHPVPLAIKAIWPDELAQLLVEADQLIRQGALNEAMAVVEKAILLAPDDAWLIMTMGNLALQMGHTEEAAKHLLKATEIDPGNSLTLTSYAGVCTELGDLQAAEQALLQALQADSSNATALKLLGQILIETGRGEQGAEALGLALQDNPDDVEGLLLLGQYSFQREEFPGARDFFRRAVDADPGNELAQNNLRAVEQILSGEK